MSGFYHLVQDCTRSRNLALVIVLRDSEQVITSEVGIHIHWRKESQWWKRRMSASERTQVNILIDMILFFFCFLIFVILLTKIVKLKIFNNFLRRGSGCNPPWFVFLKLFWESKVAKRFYVIYTNPIIHLFYKYASKFWGVVWVGGVDKVVGGGGLVKLHDSYFAYKNIWQDVCLLLGM